MYIYIYIHIYKHTHTCTYASTTRVFPSKKILLEKEIVFSKKKFNSPLGSSREKNSHEILDFLLETNFSTWVVSRKKFSRNSWFLSLDEFLHLGRLKKKFSRNSRFLSRDEFLHLGRLKKEILEKFLISFSRRISPLGSSWEFYYVMSHMTQ